MKEQLKIERPPCYISFLSYALQTERAVLPNKAWFNSHVPGPEWSPVEACRRDGNGQIISHSKYSLYLTAALGLQALCGGASEHCKVSFYPLQDHVSRVEKGWFLQFFSHMFYIAFYYNSQFYLRLVISSWVGGWCFCWCWCLQHRLANPSQSKYVFFYFYSGFNQNFLGGGIVSELSEHVTSNLYVHDPWPCDCREDPQVQTSQVQTTEMG